MHTHAGEDRLVRTYEMVYLDEPVREAEERLAVLERLLGNDPANEELKERRAAATAELEELQATLPRNGVSLLSQIKVTGYNEAHELESNRTEKLTPLQFGYTRFEPEKRDFVPLQGANLPARSLANPDTELVDLFGNGLPDILQMNGTMRYWRNLGDGRFDLPREMREAPAGMQLADPGVQLIDADGDGRTDLLVTANGRAGYYPLRFGGLWDQRSFQRFQVAPEFQPGGSGGEARRPRR